jgi:hypothetical protein
MRFAVVLLWITSVLFVGFGIGAAAAPRELALFITGGAPSIPSAIIDMRATYGGVALGMGLCFGLCATRPRPLHRPHQDPEHRRAPFHALPVHVRQHCLIR